jgi:acyl-CoA thioesterase II
MSAVPAPLQPHPALSYDATDLSRLFDLETIEQDVFRGMNRDLGTGRIFGGQVLAQSLVAASRTVPEDRSMHSLHGYFMLAGDLAIPVLYLVDRIRDGKSFTTRRVTAVQKGQPIFSMAASFHRVEKGPTHQVEMPVVPPPEELRPELDLLRERAHELPARLRAVLTQDRPLDFRPTDGLHPFEIRTHEPRRCVWLRALGDTGSDPVHHQAVLAYASDYGLLGAALQPHGLVFRDPGVMLASLDHAIWLHQPIRVDEWLLHVIDSPASGGARAFSRGSFFTRDGTLVASTAQEGLFRVTGL